MKHSIKKISQIKNSQLSKCETCNVYHLIFNNIFFEFTSKEFESFKMYVSQIEVEFWLNKKLHVNRLRKIPIPTMQENLAIIFDQQEIEELKALIFSTDERCYKLLKVDDIDYESLLN